MVVMMRRRTTTTTKRKAVTCDTVRLNFRRGHMDLIWSVCGFSRAPEGQVWGSLGALLGRLEALLGRLGALLGHSCPSGGYSGAVVGPSRGPFRPSWVPPEAF